MTAHTDSIENWFAIIIFAVSGTTELPVVAVDDDSSIARGSIVSTKK